MTLLDTRIKSGIFGQTAKFEQRPCLFHISNIGIKNKLAKQTVKILMRRLIRSCLFGFTLFANVCPILPDIRIYPTLPYIHYKKESHSSSTVHLTLLVFFHLLQLQLLAVVLCTLTLKVPIATKVVCFSRLLKCLRSLYGKQCGPRSDCSYRSSLFWVHAVRFYT